MLSLLAIPIAQEAIQTSGLSLVYFNQPLDAILFDVLIWFGWIPIFTTIVWGFIQVWHGTKQGQYAGRMKYVVLAIDVPTFTEQSPKALENLFSTLYGAKSSITWKEKWIYGRLHPVFSFEIVSTEGYIQFIIRTQTRFRDTIEAGIYAHYPDAEISEIDDYVTDIPNEYPNDDMEFWGGELTLDKPSLFPIRTYVDFEDRLTGEIKDPLGFTLEQLAKMRPGEHFWIQLLVLPSSNDWQKKGVDYVKKIYGKEEAKKKSFIAGAAETLLSWPSALLDEAIGVDLSSLLSSEGATDETDPWKAFKITPVDKEESDAILRKSGKVGHGVKLRVLYLAKKNAFVKVERTTMIKGIFGQYTHLNLNRFSLHIPSVPKDDYFWMRWEYTKRQRILMKAYKGRSWGIGGTPFWLNAEELATLWHFPTISVKAPLVKKAEAKRGEPPVGLPITAMENTLPGFDRELTDPGATHLAGLATADAATSEPPIGLPVGLGMDVSSDQAPTASTLPSGPQLDVPLPETLPTVEAPTATEEPEEESPFTPTNLPV